MRRLVAASGSLCDHARRRYAVAAGHRAAAGRDHRASVESGGDRSGHARAPARLHHYPAAREHRAAGRHGDPVHAHFRGHHGHRSILPGRFRRPAGSVRRSHLSRQGDLRCARFSENLRRSFSGRNAAEPRPDRRRVRGRGLASDIELFENLPLDYVSYCQRQHRWIRGDWQIAPWIFRHVPTASGGKQPNPLSIIGRWRIFDNLRRSLVPVASLFCCCSAG